MLSIFVGGGKKDSFSGMVGLCARLQKVFVARELKKKSGSKGTIARFRLLLKNDFADNTTKAKPKRVK